MPVLPHIETSQLICCANQLTGFCMGATLAFNGLMIFLLIRAIASLDIVLSNKHPKYLTLKCCLICISPYFMLSFIFFSLLNLETKSIDFVISSPDCILSLLSTNLSHILEKSSFNCF